MSGFGARQELYVAARTHPPLAPLGGWECLDLLERLEAFGAAVALVVEGHPQRGMDLSEGHVVLSAPRLYTLTRVYRMRSGLKSVRETVDVITLSPWGGFLVSAGIGFRRSCGRALLAVSVERGRYPPPKLRAGPSPAPNSRADRFCGSRAVLSGPLVTL